MRKVLLILFFGLLFFNASAQVMSRPEGTNDMYSRDTTSQTRETQVIVDGDTKYTDYKYFSIKNDTAVIDTVLNIKKEYKFNFTRKDNFELMEFHNQGQTFSKLGYSFKDNSIFPSMGFNAKQYSYFTVNEVYYYKVPTPTSELFYKKGIQQGQTMQALLTANTSQQFNITVDYKGLRSLGRYVNELANQRNFRLTSNYRNKKNTYFAKAHIYSFYIFNEQNGGLTDESVINFKENNPDYTDRERLDVNYSDADNVFEGKRYFLDHNVVLYSNNRSPREHKKKDSLDLESQFIKSDSIAKSKLLADKELILNDSIFNKSIDTIQIANTAAIKVQNDTITQENLLIDTPENIEKKSIVSTPIDTIKKPLFNLILGNSLLFETKHYRFNQESPSSIYGDTYENTTNDHTSYQRFNGQLFLQLNSAYVGSLKFKSNYFKYNYHYNSIVYNDDKTIGDKLNGTALSVGADWSKSFGKIHLNADASTILFGDINGSSLKASVMFKQKDLFNFKGYAEHTSRSPDFNKLLYQSNYKNYNWQNNFSNEVITSFGGSFTSDKWISVDASYNTVDSYTYFNEDSNPVQADETLNYYKIKVMKEFRYRKFALDNTIMYQEALSGDSFFRVPKWVTRNTIYYSTNVFKGDPLYLQTGVTFKYFSAFKMNAYNPLISEFNIQNTDNIGNFPLFDLFINLRIQRTRAYFKLENFTSTFTGRDYFSAPGYPYRDMTFRLGIVWNFFI